MCTEIDFDFVGVDVAKEGGDGLFLHSLDLHHRYFAHYIQIAGQSTKKSTHSELPDELLMTAYHDLLPV